LHGRQGLPQDWLAKLVDHEDLEADAEALARFAT
jgi:hypothetical protein